MSEPLEVSIELVNEKIKFTGRAKSNPPISIDYIPPLGDNEGYMPLELLLLSLISCLGETIAPILRKMKKNITSMKLKANGFRKEQHPTVFEKILVEILLESNDIENADIQKAIELAENKFCPVYAMLKGNVNIKIEYKIHKDTA